ncbi:hypothetical protein A2W14_04380 [Candidatus Gottesmanbacteria bacterium RBG_16_37_8]|uniref:Bacterial Ig domain-containing protein n=1 Tax=Candidatus Gottesmanbacteria bacterium RBG_16_37_8 TaxID=1798371 RepID=A0A1F5YSN9_9BACT|nr:MAG: hypothetical protein A2W14_04380 [Candidatus Gottesmanbacteria bacterium RBG_16_37_8]
MKKDVILALVAGFIIGSGIAILAVKLPVMLSTKVAPKEETNKTPPLPSAVTNLKDSLLTINQPRDQTIFNEDGITLLGKTKPSAAIVVESPLTSNVYEADKNGSFSAKLKLTEGGNPVYITAIDETGESESKTLTFFYSTEKL